MTQRSEEDQRLIAALQRIAPGGDLRALAAEHPKPRGGPGFRGRGTKGQPIDITAHAAVVAVLQNEPLNDFHRICIRSIVDKSLPVIDVINDSFTAPAGRWSLLDAEPTRGFILSLILATGRINFRSDSGRLLYATGFLIGEGLLCTNRHVAKFFCVGIGQSGLSCNREVSVDFVQEIESRPPDVFEILEPVMIHPHWDWALLRLKEPYPARPQLTFDIDSPDNLNGRPIALVGYPKRSADAGGFNHQTELLKNRSGVKRLQPGYADPRHTYTDEFGNTVNVLSHDASTLPSNSGSPVLDLRTGRAVGVHIGGEYLVDNYAVPAYELARDARVVAADVSFAGSLPTTDEWDEKWDRADASGIAGGQSIV